MSMRFIDQRPRSPTHPVTSAIERFLTVSHSLEYVNNHTIRRRRPGSQHRDRQLGAHKALTGKLKAERIPTTPRGLGTEISGASLPLGYHVLS